MHTYFCDHCGAALDPGEICDCKQQPEESERRIVTYADWEAAGDFTKAARPGDYVEERIVDDMRDVLPPAKMERGFLQAMHADCHQPASRTATNSTRRPATGAAPSQPSLRRARTGSTAATASSARPLRPRHPSVDKGGQ